MKSKKEYLINITRSQFLLIMKGDNAMKKISISLIMVIIMLFSVIPSYASNSANINASEQEKEILIGDNEALKEVNHSDAQIILKELNLEKAELSEEEKVAILTSGNAAVWNTTYKNQSNIKKSFSMTANLNAGGTKPYTTFTITNKGKNKITAIAYKGSIGGSNTIRTVTIAANSSKTLKVTRADVIKYGKINGQGTASILSYSISLYNTNGNAISCAVKGIRYN